MDFGYSDFFLFGFSAVTSLISEYSVIVRLEIDMLASVARTRPRVKDWLSAERTLLVALIESLDLRNFSPTDHISHLVGCARDAGRGTDAADADASRARERQPKQPNYRCRHELLFKPKLSEPSCFLFGDPNVDRTEIHSVRLFDLAAGGM